ncbi:MAG: immune inhibitor A, partial [Prevotellaceae bacterium]|nr:immune inhibitor A [Prevotellaceae bacterium]
GAELRGRSGEVMAGIGTFCHEFSHVLGLPDLYNTYNKNSTVYSWDIMDAGCYNINGSVPCLYSAYETFFCGWLQPTLLECMDSSYSLPPLTPYLKKAFLISNASQHNLDGKNPAPAQFFILENRKKELWDKGLPTSGMLIWKINYSRSSFEYNNPNNEKPYKIDIIEADDNENQNTLIYDVFGTNGYNSHIFKWDDNTSWNKSLENITRNASNGNITFDYYCKKTVEGNNDRILPVQLSSDGSVIVTLNEEDINNQDLYVYTVTGQLVRRIPYSSFAENPTYKISGLTPNNSYIISLGSKRKSKFAKVFVK